MTPEINEMTDERINGLLDYCRNGQGFANNAIWRFELAGLLIEVQRARRRPLHCPGCDGDHL